MDVVFSALKNVGSVHLLSCSKKASFGGHSCCLGVSTLLTSVDPKFIQMFASFQQVFWSEIFTGLQQTRAITRRVKISKQVYFIISD